MRKTMSLKQIAANQRNARKSTGPRTVNGMAVSKMNALKHGILSKEVLVSGTNIRESRNELVKLHQRFREELAPAGPVEEMLVDQIVTAHWRLRRALTAESGEIALSVDEGQRKRSRPPHPVLQWALWEGLGDPVPTMEESSMGNSVLLSYLVEVRVAVEREGELTEAPIQRLVQHFGGKPNSLSRELGDLRLKLQENPDGLEPAALRERNRQRALAYLDRRISDKTWWKNKCREREEKEDEARQAAATLPSMDVLEKISRYETKLERQLYRAMAHLERLQRIRQGEAVPAPMTVAVS